jgi:hypothetical protein
MMGYYLIVRAQRAGPPSHLPSCTLLRGRTSANIDSYPRCDKAALDNYPQFAWARPLTVRSFPPERSSLVSTGSPGLESCSVPLACCWRGYQHHPSARSPSLRHGMESAAPPPQCNARLSLREVFPKVESLAYKFPCAVNLITFCPWQTSTEIARRAATALSGDFSLLGAR